MSLVSYDQTRPWAKSIARRIEDASMPPWHASPEYGVFSNDRRLETAERDALLAWAAAGAPAGNLREAPAAPVYGAAEWRIGEPDIIIEMPEEVTVPANGQLPYHDYIVDPGFEEDVLVLELCFVK